MQRYSYTPMICLSGKLYFESGEFSGVFSQEQAQYGFREIGTIQQEVPGYTIPQAHLSANFALVGATVYLSADERHAYLTVPKGLLRYDLFEDETRAFYELSSLPDFP